MPLPDSDSSVGHSFGVEFDGVPIRNIVEVSGLKLEQDVIELKEVTADGGYAIKRLPGRQKAGELTLTRGVTHDADFETWIRRALAAPSEDAGRRGGAVIVFDFEGREIKRYGVVNARPRSLEIGTLKAGDNSVLVERLVLTYESLQIG